MQDLREIQPSPSAKLTTQRAPRLLARAVKNVSTEEYVFALVLQSCIV